MRKHISISFLFCLLTGNALAQDQTKLTDEADRINYTIGHQIGTDFKRQKVELNKQAIRQGMLHGQAGNSPSVNSAEMKEMLVDLKRNISNKMKQEAIARTNKAREIEKQKRDKGKAFMKKNQAREGVKTMPSGLQYEVLKNGAGAKPEPEDYVTIHYRARTLDGKEYDSSFKKGGPVTYRANGVIPGFNEAIQMMRPGAKWTIYVPPEMAYGRQGPLAHQTIIIDLELLSISNKPEKAEAE